MHFHLGKTWARLISRQPGTWFVGQKMKEDLEFSTLRCITTICLLRTSTNSWTGLMAPWVRLVWETYYQQSLPLAPMAPCSFWWSDCLKLLSDYKTHATPIVSSGDATLFSSDPWRDRPLADKWPHLHSFTVDQHLSMRQVLRTPDIQDLFHLPLSKEAYGQFQQLQILRDSTKVSVERDVWSFNGNQLGFSVSKAYQLLIGTHNNIPAMSWVWKTCCRSKHKVFFWLLLNNRLNTRELLQRRNFHIEDYTCTICGVQTLETRDHLFFHC